MRAWLTDVARATGGEAWEAGGVACAWHPVPHRELLLLFPPADAAAIDDALARGGALGAGGVGCWAAAPDDALGRVLAARGFCAGWAPRWMALDLRTPLPSGGAGAARAAAGWQVAEAAEVPEWDGYGQALLRMGTARAFVARVDGAFAGFCWLHDSGGLFDLVVLEPFRRRGLGTALTLAAARAARTAGHGRLVLNATGDGAALYATLGFTTLGSGATWWRHAPDPPPSARAG